MKIWPRVRKVFSCMLGPYKILTGESLGSQTYQPEECKEVNNEEGQPRVVVSKRYRK